VRECAFLASMLPGRKSTIPYRKMDRVMKRSDRILRRMVAARMISREEYDVAMAEVPNLAGLERKVEKTLETRRPRRNRRRRLRRRPGGDRASPPGQMNTSRCCVAAATRRPPPGRGRPGSIARRPPPPPRTLPPPVAKRRGRALLLRPPEPASDPARHRPRRLRRSRRPDRIGAPREEVPAPDPRRLESIPAFFNSSRMSSRNFFGSRSSPRDPGSGRWSLRDSGRRTSGRATRTRFLINACPSGPYCTYISYQKIGYIALRVDQALRLPVRLGELGVGDVAVPVAVTRATPQNRKIRAEADQRDEVRRPAGLSPARHVRQSSTGHAATHDMQPVHSRVHTDGFSWTRSPPGTPGARLAVDCTSIRPAPPAGGRSS